MATIRYLTQIEFAPGEIGNLRAHLDALGVKRPLLVTDPGIKAAGLVARLVQALGSTPVTFEETPANPTEAAALAAHDLYQRESCDGVIGFGGGSALDLAKAVRLLSGHPPPLAQYTAVAGGIQRIHDQICPMIAIPTTAGTGSEVGRGAVIITAEGRKLGILSPHLLPSIALCDPELTYGLPPLLTAATGMDAISHCLETFMSSAVNPPADAIALHGLELGLGAIEEASLNGQNTQARSDMMIAAFEGAMAFQKGLGAVHALSHPMGALPGLTLHHGTLNALLMPAVLRFNRPAIGAKWVKLAALLGGPPDTVIASLVSRLGLPPGLDALGLTPEMLDHVAAEAPGDHCHGTNPRIASVGDYRALLEEAR